jgi:hypothetical protein
MHAVVTQICEEFGFDAGSAEAARLVSAVDKAPGVGDGLAAEDEELVAAVRTALSKLAAGAGASAGKWDEAIATAVSIALGGAELVMRGEIASGKKKVVRGLAADFVFMVCLPVVEQDEALSLSRRAGELLKRELRG